jgi:excisionase family DNA binding protein
MPENNIERSQVMAKIIKRAYTISEACQYLGGISRPTLYKLMGDGGLPLYRIGRRVFFTKESLDEFINGRVSAERGHQ